MRNVYKIHEVNKHRFYQVPKELFENEYYSDLSNDSKMLYGMLLDRMKLSEKNNWVNDNDEIYLIFARTTAQDLLNISNKTAVKVFKELKEKELIFEERQGLNKPNIIFIGKINYKKSAEKPENSRKCKNYTSRSEEFTGQEVKNLHPNDTELNDTELSDTEINNKKGSPSGEEERSASLSFEKAAKEFGVNEWEYNNTKYYLQKYREVLGTDHPNLKQQQWEKVFNNITYASDLSYTKEAELFDDEFKAVVDKHFKTNYRNCDYNILHFISGQIMINRAYELDLAY
ncbi:MAG: replication initiator protein A [bacterium]